jgi:hypothetical protein
LIAALPKVLSGQPLPGVEGIGRRLQMQTEARQLPREFPPYTT